MLHSAMRKITVVKVVSMPVSDHVKAMLSEPNVRLGAKLHTRCLDYPSILSFRSLQKIESRHAAHWVGATRL